MPAEGGPRAPRGLTGAKQASLEHEDEDCNECRLTGTALCLGVSAYSFAQRYTLKPHEMKNKRWLGFFSGCWLLGSATMRDE